MAVYKDKEKGTWYAKFRYTDWQGKSHVTTKRGFRTQREAKAYEASMQSKASPENTLSDVLTAYLSDRKPNVKPSTYHGLERDLEGYVRPKIGHVKLKDIDAKLIRDWQLSVQAHKCVKTGKPLSSGTLYTICAHLSTALNYAVRYYGLPNNPMKVIGLLGEKKSSHSFWTLEQYNKFSAVIEDESWKLLFDILFYSGMRLGELLALSPADIDFDRGTISITKNVMWLTGEISTPKNKQSVRTIAMPAFIMERIKSYIGRYYDTPERIFTATHNRVEAVIRKYAALADLPAIRVHDLRHSHVSLLIHKGVPITAISHRLGHASPATTLRVYSHMYEEAQTEIANMLDNL